MVFRRTAHWTAGAPPTTAKLADSTRSVAPPTERAPAALAETEFRGAARRVKAVAADKRRAGDARVRGTQEARAASIATLDKFRRLGLTSGGGRRRSDQMSAGGVRLIRGRSADRARLGYA